VATCAVEEKVILKEANAFEGLWAQAHRIRREGV